ncbi:phosphomevalonate kinase [Virgibacillus sp. NKC19-3]|uniref:phosphomevalonate kinase n=1 Tax=Virgibacillus saliphilus TaxID=2831674 RepID=UPI001C9B2A8D|nr:phosphomevalonate kinase [Virgibacillus sp. NKC19-3]MBY7141842.1 phosphomevalonate kinase [Virgibacillus sp. NKC19-3]
MCRTPMTIKVPGKLMIAGEFAVLHPHHNLVVMAVDRFVYASIQQSDKNRLTLEDFKLHDLRFAYNNKDVKIDTDDERVHFIEQAMSLAFTYLKEHDVKPDPFKLSIRSELDDVSGVKYGLGSSAAVVTSVITAILKKYLPYRPSAMLIFKLAAVSHVITQRNGSGADVAASSYGGFLQYSSFQSDWLIEAYENAKTLQELLEQDWVYFSLKPMKLLEDVYVCIGWTGKPASTKKLVDEILKLKNDDPARFQQFLTSSENAVGDFLKGMTESDIALLLKGVKENRQALQAVGQHANVDIETPLLRTLCDLAEGYGGAGKPSGAGGGDCGIAFMPSQEKAKALMQAWEQAGIKPLAIQPYEYGAIEAKRDESR